MTKVFLVGDAPLPWQNSAKRPAGGLRTWQFLKPLLEAGHEVRAVLWSRSDFWLGDKIEQDELSIRDYSAKCEILMLDRDFPKWQQTLQAELEKFKPDVVVAVNSLSCERVTRLDLTVPFWADINGSPIMEAEAQAWRLGSDDLLPHFWAREKKILETADIISTCSNNQKLATFGMLATLGRLNHKTSGQKLLFAIPNLTEVWPETDEVMADLEPILRGKILPQKAVIVSMVGGWWNSWLDENTLFFALENAMRENENIYFIAGGGAVPGLTLAPLDNFRARVEKSRFKDHFYLLGWLPTKHMAQIYREIDICITADRDCADTRTGARNRITEWAKFGLPIITTKGSEVANDLITHAAAVGVDIGDVVKMTNAVLWLAGDQKLRRKTGQLAQEYCTQNWNYGVGMRDFIQWIRKPFSARDAHYFVGMKVNFWHTKVRAGFRYMKENGFKKTFGKFKELVLKRH
ncbi:MAG: hypothetical protein NTZ80_04100 [Patescibacteria group bacterium]|nr:hypothetical protein [Patescibacteria group bacterium]